MPKPIEMQRVTLTGGYLFEKEQLVRAVTLPALYKSYEDTGRIHSFKLSWRNGEPGEPHIFWDSDIAKWIEGASYTLMTQPDAELEKTVDAIVADMAAGQTAEGYFNVRYQTVEMSNRFTRRGDHELYCAGHLMEAAVAYYRATGKTAMLDIMRRYADHIEDVFIKKDRPPDFITPGHEEIELALVKLYEATGETRYLALSKFFIDRRGYSEEEKNHNRHWFGPEYAQDHLPARKQKTAEGHAVRALYLYAGMADHARFYGDDGLRDACEALFDDIVNKKMYVTGGLGGNYHGEAFSREYDLPNELAYAETCASIAMMFFTQRMFLLTGEAKYIDALERMLYNAVPAGLSVSGDRFFYTNPLEMHSERHEYFLQRQRGQYAPECERPVDFGCSCCPPNIIRLFASAKGYMYHEGEGGVYINLYGSSVISMDGLQIEQDTAYPWDGAVRISLHASTRIRKVLYLRIPKWCKQYRVSLNGETIQMEDNNGYIAIDREWSGDDTVLLHMDMPVTEIYAHPLAHYNAGRVAIRRGPVVYCAESADNGAFIKSFIIKKDACYRSVHNDDLLGGVTVINGDAWVPRVDGGTLYQEQPFPYEEKQIRLIPYAVWANRGRGEMNVWLMKEAGY